MRDEGDPDRLRRSLDADTRSELRNEREGSDSQRRWVAISVLLIFSFLR